MSDEFDDEFDEREMMCFVFLIMRLPKARKAKPGFAPASTAAGNDSGARGVFRA